MTHDHHYPVQINAKELSPGSVLVSADPRPEISPVLATGRGVVHMSPHDDDQGGDTQSQATISPIEHLLGGVALSLSQILKMVVLQHDMSVHQIFVAASQERSGSQTTITREIIVDGHITEEHREVLEKAANNCPVQRILNGNITVNTVVA